MSAIWLLCTVGVWQRLLHRFSWIKTFGIACVAFAPTEFLMFSLTPGDEGMWAIVSVVQQICSVGFNLAYANILYPNLPREESTACISFNTIGCNLFAFLGMITGTLVSSIGGEGTISFLREVGGLSESIPEQRIQSDCGRAFAVNVFSLQEKR